MSRDCEHGIRSWLARGGHVMRGREMGGVAVMFLSHVTVKAHGWHVMDA